MQHAAHSRSRVHRRNRLKVCLVLAALASLAVLGVLVFFHSPDPGHSDTDTAWVNSVGSGLSELPSSTFPKSDSAQPRRPVYRYSVIPGGVRSAQELKDAVAKDPVVAQHYAGFQRDRARLAALPAAKAVYVSYRIGSAVFWTKKKLMLAKGENVITDGESSARARCGNRISETPQAKTSPEEPSPKAFETRVDPADREFTAVLINPSPPNEPNPFVFGAPVPGSPPTVPPTTGGGVFIPIIPIVPIPNGNPPSSSPPPQNPPPPPTGPPLTPIPEPGTLLLVASGLAGILGYRRSLGK